MHSVEERWDLEIFREAQLISPLRAADGFSGDGAEIDRQILFDLVGATDLLGELSSTELQVRGKATRDFDSEIELGCELPDQRCTARENRPARPDTHRA